MEHPFVSICCITYNHEDYIEDCLNGFIHQKTDFPFEIVISNDCSTDNTQRIIDKYIRKYPGVIRDISPNYNLGMMKNYYYALNKCQGKYIAYCEGDDYWNDENKLQKQIDYLENNLDVGMCYTNVSILNESKKKIEGLFCNSNNLKWDLLKNGNNIPTLSVCFRRDVFLDFYKFVNPLDHNWLMGDYPVWLWFFFNSKITYLNCVTAVYRRLNESACHTNDVDKKMKFNDSYHSIRQYYSTRYSIKIDVRTPEKELFNIYCRLLKQDCFNLEIRRNVSKQFAKLTRKSLHDVFFLLCSRFPIILWMYIKIGGN